MIVALAEHSDDNCEVTWLYVSLFGSPSKFCAGAPGLQICPGQGPPRTRNFRFVDLPRTRHGVALHFDSSLVDPKLVQFAPSWPQVAATIFSCNHNSELPDGADESASFMSRPRELLSRVAAESEI